MTDLDLPDTAGLSWSVEIGEPGRMPLTSFGADRPLRTASVGKVLLLLEVASQISGGELDPQESLGRESAVWVGDSGLWHVLTIDRLPASDVASLVGAVSDNLATNVLLDRVGLAAVTALTERLGLKVTALHDHVRDERGPEHPATLSTGSATELRGLIDRCSLGEAISMEADSLMLQWISANVDQSMVGSAFVDRWELDPIAHHESIESPLRLANKTGTDSGIRADVGIAGTRGRWVSWAAIANWEPTGHADDARLTAAAMQGMRRVGEYAVAQLSE